MSTHWRIFLNWIERSELKIGERTEKEEEGGERTEKEEERGIRRKMREEGEGRGD